MMSYSTVGGAGLLGSRPPRVNARPYQTLLLGFGVPKSLWKKGIMERMYIQGIRGSSEKQNYLGKRVFWKILENGLDNFFKAFERCIVLLRIAGHGEKSNILRWFLRYGRSTMVIRV
jgi:hypothetical protein